MINCTFHKKLLKVKFTNLQSYFLSNQCVSLAIGLFSLQQGCFLSRVEIGYLATLMLPQQLRCFLSNMMFPQQPYLFPQELGRFHFQQPGCFSGKRVVFLVMQLKQDVPLTTRVFVFLHPGCSLSNRIVSLPIKMFTQQLNPTDH